MVNNRKTSSVVDMKWSPDGSKICIAYEDGNIIVGGVEGNRKWGKDYTHRVRLVAWTPSSKELLVGTNRGEVFMYDEMGELLHQLRLQGLQRIVEPENFLTPDIPLAGIDWFEDAQMYSDDGPVGLCIAYEQGRLILMKNDKDEDPIAVDTSMILTKVKWNPTGTMLAVAGSSLEFEEKRAVVKFFDGKGNHLKNLRIPNAETVRDITW